MRTKIPKSQYSIVAGKTKFRPYTAPKWLEDESKAIFLMTTEALTKSGTILSNADYSILASYAFNVYEHYKLSTIIQTEGATFVEDESGERKVNAAVKARADIQKEIHQQQKQLGISPKFHSDLYTTVGMLPAKTVEGEQIPDFTKPLNTGGNG